MHNLKPKRPRRHVRGRISKRVILKTATALFISKGFDKTTIRDISDTGQLGYGTVYQYFKGKEYILCGIIDDLLYPYYLMLAKEAEPDNPIQAREYFNKVTLELLNIADQDKEIMEVYYDTIPISEIVAEHWKSTLDKITDNIFEKLLTSSKVEIRNGLDNKMVLKSYKYLLDRFIIGIVKGNEDNIESIANTIESVMFDGVVEN